jgi:dihydrofolate reductase
MPRVRVNNIAVSVDGYAAGPDQSLENPIGVGGSRLHEWLFPTRSFREMQGRAGGEEGPDNDFAVAGNLGVGATIMGRNMFGPIRGPWADAQWSGWWGDEPPYHHPVFVLTNHPRDPITMQGGTVFHFVTDGIHAALTQAMDSAGGQDVKIAGGVSTIQQYLRASLVDELEVAIAPVLLGSGERLFDHLGGSLRGFECTEFVGTQSALHARFTRTGPGPGSPMV